MNNGHVFPKVQNIVRVLLPTVNTNGKQESEHKAHLK